MTNTRNHYLITATRSDRTTEHTGENVVVEVKNHSSEWTTPKTKTPETVGNMRVHFNENQDYEPYDLISETKKADAHTNSFTHIANTNNATADDWLDDEWSADDFLFSEEEEGWAKGGSYVSPFAYDGIEDSEWSTNLSEEARNLLPSDSDSPLLQSLKVLSAVLITAGGLFLVLKPPLAGSAPDYTAERSRWLQVLEE